jgi:hypothetical protein
MIQVLFLRVNDYFIQSAVNGNKKKPPKGLIDRIMNLCNAKPESKGMIAAMNTDSI